MDAPEQSLKDYREVFLNNLQWAAMRNCLDTRFALLGQMTEEQYLEAVERLNRRYGLGHLEDKGEGL